MANGLLVELLLGTTTTSRSDLLAQLDRLSSHAPAEDTGALVGRIARRIVEKCCVPLDAPRLARDYAMDETTLRKEFKRHVGVTPREYHLRARVSLALDLLRSGNHKIGSIARQVGYREEKNFFRQVRRFTGRTPGQLRALPDATLRSIARNLLDQRHQLLTAAPRVIERRVSSPRRSADRELRHSESEQAAD